MTLFEEVLRFPYIKALCRQGRRGNNSDMHLVAVNLRKLLKAQGLSESALARHTGLAQATVHRVLSGKVRDPRDSTLRPMALHFGVSVDALRTGLPDLDVERKDAASYAIRTPHGLALREPGRDVAVIEVSARVTATGSRPAFEFVATGLHSPYPAAWFAAHGVAPAQVRAMAVRGASMEPILFEGDTVAISLASTRIEDGRVYLFISGGRAADARIRRLFRTSHGALRVVSDNADKTRYPDELLSADDIEQLIVIGRVVDRRGAGGL